MAASSNGLYKTAIEQSRKELVAAGQRILRECVAERDYTHRSNNLYDSYGFGVYVNGKLVNRGYLSNSPTAKAAKKWYGEVIRGRSEIDKYLVSEYAPGNGLELVVVAAMPYAVVLERGSAGLHRKYKVISMAYDKLLAICPSFGRVKTILQ